MMRTNGQIPGKIKEWIQLIQKTHHQRHTHNVCNSFDIYE